ncbi:sugar phosphate isomerase/epimerase family protein [Thermomonospora cellulosilytica]|uniref:Sugar phosphate isomerase/epimerase n=1 Tax=Thermomonospora cellulosilytica TaxID=1411118 RepID=A0A7W3R8D2_9ACTN|nr:sugar phosphate isomerase/epimerase family protein [Thermomonospora cellulosilytica]MBA9004213.1 sugar phosphate isomerase/epimerase [Thermomonospora cellulosilytica]
MTDLDVPSGRPAAVPTPEPGDARLHRLSLNQKTIDRWNVAEAVAGCAAAGVPAIGLWREPVRAYGLRASAKLVAEAGLRVSSLCRGGFLTSPDPDAWRNALDDNRRAIDEAAELGAACLVLVVGGLPPGSRDLPAARARVAESLDLLVPYAVERNVRLALEPMHPLYTADRGVLATLGEALDLAERFPSSAVGVVVDSFHTWWDPQLPAQLTRAGERIAGVQLADWITPLPPDALLSRGMLGDGHIDLRGFVRLTDAAGYTGDIEVEIFNADVWAADGAQTLATVCRRWTEHVI